MEMNMMPVSDATKAVIRDAMAEGLAPVRIDRVEIRPDRDHDGEEVLQVVVVFESDKPAVDGRALLAASVMAQKALGAVDDSRFALIEYVTASDADQAAE